MNKLDELSELQAKRDLLKLQKAERHRAIVEPVAQALLDLEFEYALPETEVEAELEMLMAEIKADVLAHGASLRGERSNLQAVWSKPRVTWDTRRLEGYAAAHPEIAEFKKVGEPSVSIRAIGEQGTHESL